MRSEQSELNKMNMLTRCEGGGNIHIGTICAYGGTRRKICAYSWLQVVDVQNIMRQYRVKQYQPYCGGFPLVVMYWESQYFYTPGLVVLPI